MFLEEVTCINPKSVPNRVWNTYTCYGIYTDDNTSIMERIHIYYGISVGSSTFIMELPLSKVLYCLYQASLSLLDVPRVLEVLKTVLLESNVEIIQIF